MVTTEVEALQLEYNWIKEFDPRFNVRYRDDKTYPVLAVTMNEEFPRLHVYRGPRRKGVRYFGPYAHAWAIRETLDLLLRVFPARTCSAGVFKRHGQIGRPCLLGYIDKCSAPCVGRVDRRRAPRHRRGLLRLPLRPHRPDDARSSSGGWPRRRRSWSSSGRPGCATTSARCAGRWRRQAVVLGDGTDADVVAFAEDELEAAVQVFHVRGGRVRGQRGWVVDKVEPTDTAQLVERFLTQFYGEQAALAERGRRRAPAGAAGDPGARSCRPSWTSLAEWLSGLRGSRVRIRVPQRGDKRALAETVARNAAEAFTQHKLRRAGDLTARSAALPEIQDALGPGLGAAAHRVHRRLARAGHQRGRLAGGLRGRAGPQVRVPPVRDPGRRRGRATSASIAEVVRRRFRRYLAETGGRCAAGNGGRDQPDGSGIASQTAPAHRPGIDPETGRPRKFAYPPNLLVVDGGQPQVEAAADVLAELGVTDVAVCGLAKRLEEVWLPAEPDPVILSRTSEGLYLLQRVRDEAHRFAITYHRQRRSKGMTRSELDAVPGLGPARRAALLKHFGSVRKLKAAERRRDRRAARLRPAHRGRRARRAARPSGRRSRRRTPATSLRRRMTDRAGCRPDDRPTGATGRPASRSRWSAGCPGPGAAPRPRSWRTSAGSWWTTCRRS